jgi:single-strand DNA-binding protein
MSISINEVVLMGNLGSDPEIKVFKDGSKVANFNLATSESWKDKQTGEKKSKTFWHRIVVKNQNLIDIIERFVAKGSKIYIRGSLETREYEDNNKAKQYITEVVMGYSAVLKMLGSKNENKNDLNDSDFNQDKSNYKKQSQDLSFIDDEVPF